MTPDMHKRAERLREFIDDLYKFREDALADNDVDLEADPPVVPHRFAASEYDGSESYLGLYDSIEDANDGAAGSLMGEVPWSPYQLLDLDTGNVYEAHVTVKFEPLAYVARWRYRYSDDMPWHKGEQRFSSEEAAKQALATMTDTENYRAIGIAREWDERTETE